MIWNERLRCIERSLLTFACAVERRMSVSSALAVTGCVRAMSCAKSAVLRSAYSSAMRLLASSVMTGRIHLAMWMYFFMNWILTILSDFFLEQKLCKDHCSRTSSLIGTDQHRLTVCNSSPHLLCNDARLLLFTFAPIESKKKCVRNNLGNILASSFRVAVRRTSRTWVSPARYPEQRSLIIVY